MKNKVLMLVVTLCLLLTVSLSYAYFTGKASGDPKELLVTSKNVRILFEDSMEITDANIRPGWSESKTFSVKNESNDIFNYNIIFENLVNTFVTEGFLQYKITSDTGYTMDGYLDIPKSSTPSDVILAYDIEIEPGATQEYTVEFVYHNSDTVDQSDDMGKIFEGNLAIIEGTADPSVKYTVIMNADNAVVTPMSAQAIKYQSLDFSVTPDTGYDIDTMNVSCDPVANTTISNNIVSVNNIRQDYECTVTFDKLTYVVNVSSTNTTYGTVSPASSMVSYQDDLVLTLMPEAGYEYSSDTCGGTVSGNKLTISNITEDKACTVTFEPSAKTLANAIKKAYTPQDGRTLFSSVDTGTPKLYTDTDDQGTTYYFSGNGTNMNNWVSFAGSLWRVIRINGNGSVRMLYAGSGSTDGYINNSTLFYNSTRTHPQYVGWKYTEGNSLEENRENGTKSAIYGEVETWYNGLDSKYQALIDEEAIYCNDRNIGSGPYSTSSTFYYAAYTRLIDNKTPTFKCSNEADRFTGSGGYIPVGLMTADEVVYAGGLWNTNNQYAYYYLNASGGSSIGSHYWWTMSPTYYHSSDYKNARVFAVYGSSDPGRLYSHDVNSSYVVRPVVSLKSDTLVTGGTGSASDPYTVGMSLADTLKAAYTPQSGRTSFSSVDTGTPKLYTDTDDQGTTYYFSGKGTNMNNWVSFAGSLWRVIRINGNGSVRMLYAGSGSTDGYIGTSAYNSTDTHPQYVGWKYTAGSSLAANRENGTSSTIYGVVETWYNRLDSKYKELIDQDAIYCNDRSILSGSYSTSSTFYYAASTRIITNNTPTFKCSDEADRFTGTGGYIPVGLMTADEVAYAGGVYGTNNQYAYYYLNASGGSSTGSGLWWTMSPSYYSYNSSSGSYAYVFRVSGSSYPGRLSNGDVNTGSNDVRPVVSLKSSALVTGGTGTASDPYTIQEG